MSKGDDAGLPRGTFNSVIALLVTSNNLVMSVVRALADEENRSEDSETDAAGKRIEAKFTQVKKSAAAANKQLLSYSKTLNTLRTDLNSLSGLYPRKVRRKGVR
jgi:chromosome segregation ATPase